MRIVDKFVEAWHDASDTVDNQIFAIPLGELRGITLDISTYATPGKFRLIHCGRFLNEQVLAIHEISSLDIPSYSYAAISYPWEGLPRNNNNTYNTFTVEGTGKIEREKGPKKYKPVSIDVLTHACKAATSDGDNLKNKSAKGCRYIWLDKLCMLQEDHDDEAPDVRTPEKKDRDEKAKKDKDWQIMHMWDIYSKCRMCIILPGGMGRLARVEEDTTWIQRSWTFQEAIAQLENAFVLFRWIHGKVDIYGKDGANFHYSEVSPGESAMCTLDVALQCNCLGKDGTLPILTEQGGHQILINLVGRTNDPHVTAFLAVTDARHAVTEARDTVEEKQRDLTETQRIITTKAGFAPEKVAHDVSEARFAVTQSRRSLSEVEDAYRQGIWRCSLMRSSSRPVDTVFSIMGAFGVTLNPKDFKDSQDKRQSATIALAKGLLQKGQRASWLAPFISLPPAKGLSAFPKFPRMSVAKPAMLGRRRVAELLDARTGWLDDLPSGSMDDRGYLNFSAPAVPLVHKIISPAFVAADGSRWIREHRPHQPVRAYLVLIGKLRPYPGLHNIFPQDLGKDLGRALLLEENGDGTVYRRSYVILSDAQYRALSSRLAGPAREFRLGGGEFARWSRLLCC